MKNKYAKYAFYFALLSFVYLGINYLWHFIDYFPFNDYDYITLDFIVLFPLLAIGLGIKGLWDFKKDNSIGGEKTSKKAIYIGTIFIVVIVILMYIQAMLAAETLAKAIRSIF